MEANREVIGPSPERGQEKINKRTGKTGTRIPLLKSQRRHKNNTKEGDREEKWEGVSQTSTAAPHPKSHFVDDALTWQLAALAASRCASQSSQDP